MQDGALQILLEFVCVAFHIQGIIICQAEKATLVVNPARDLLNRDKRTKDEVWQRTTYTPLHAAHTKEIKKRTDNGRNRMCPVVSWTESGIEVLLHAGRFGSGSR